MFCQTWSLFNPFVIDRTISLFNLESQIFVTLATRASLGHISMTTLNCLPFRAHILVHDCRLFILYDNMNSVIVNFLLQFLHFRYRDNKGRPGVNFNDTIK